MNIEAARVENDEIELIVKHFIKYYYCKIDVINVSIKSANVAPSKTKACRT